MIRFYDVDLAYINYLKQIDSKVPNISYNSNNKFVCGAVLELNGIQYFAPISHNSTLYRTSFGIYDSGQLISTVRFCFMFPTLQNVLSEKQFSVIRTYDQNYANLLEKEWRYCVANEKDLRKKAESVYKMGCNCNHPMFKNCCDFKKLEANYLNYLNNRTIN